MLKKILLGLFILGTTALATGNIKSVKANSHDKDHRAENTIDGNLGSRWANREESWIVYEFKKEMELSQLDIATFKGDERKQKFDLEVSIDGNEWNKVFEAESTGATKEFERYTFAPVKAKFVKINGYGTDVAETWTGITEVRFSSKDAVKTIISK